MGSSTCSTLSSLADFEALPRSVFVAESVSPLVPQDKLCVLQNAYTFLYDEFVSCFWRRQGGKMARRGDVTRY